MENLAKPNEKVHFVRYNREFAITVIVITEFDCNFKYTILKFALFNFLRNEYCFVSNSRVVAVHLAEH